MDKLVALPVKGESYLLRRGAQSILVDGGYNPIGLRAAIKEIHPDLKMIDVVVCTHADRDHAGGLVDISSHISDREFWIPGEWGPLATGLLSHPEIVLREVIEELQQRSTTAGHSDNIEQASDQEVDLLERLASRERAERPRRASYDGGLAEDRRRSHDAPTREGQEPANDKRENPVLIYPEMVPPDRARRAFASARRKVTRLVRVDKVNARLAKHWLSMISTAERIRLIAANAIARGSRLRWFDFSPIRYGQLPSGGEPGMLVPLNAVELKSWPNFTDLSYLALLTPVNEESLVFCAARLGALGSAFLRRLSTRDRRRIHRLVPSTYRVSRLGRHRYCPASRVGKQQSCLRARAQQGARHRLAQSGRQQAAPRSHFPCTSFRD